MTTNRPMVAALTFLMVALAGASQSAAAGFTNAGLHGPYACSATGGFISTSAQAIIQFSTDGKRNVTSGAMTVQLDGEGTIGNGSSSPSTSSPWHLFHDAFENCSYTSSGGTYSISSNGVGTATVNWTAAAGNQSSPVDCTENITAHYSILMVSKAALNFTTNDLLGAGGALTFADFGEALSGSCAIQTPK